MISSPQTIGFNGFSMVLGSFNHWLQWFSMVRDHWSNDAMVSMYRTPLSSKLLMTNILSKETKLFSHVESFAIICYFQDRGWTWAPHWWVLRSNSWTWQLQARLHELRKCLSITCGPLLWSGQEPGLEATLSLSSRQGQCRPAIMMQIVY